MRPGCSNGSVLRSEARIRIPPNYHNTAQASHLVDDGRRLMKRNLPSGTRTGGRPKPSHVHCVCTYLHSMYMVIAPYSEKDPRRGGGSYSAAARSPGFEGDGGHLSVTRPDSSVGSCHEAE